jgi:hypothetical protein
MSRLKLPAFNYYLDESDPDIVVLRRQDGSFVAAFSAQGVTKEGIREAAMEDYRALVEAHTGVLGPLGDRATSGRLIHPTE